MLLTIKPPAGEAGRQGRIIVNCLPITSLPMHPFYHYDVAFDATPGERARAQIIDRLIEQEPMIFTPRPIYDGNKNLFSPHRLQFANGADFSEFAVGVGGTGGGRREKKPSSVRIQFAQALQPHDMQLLHSTNRQERNQRLSTITLLNLLVRNAPSQERGVVSKGRGFFTSARKVTPQGDYPVVEFWAGLIQSIRPALHRVVLNLDTTVTMMYHPGRLLDNLCGLVGARDIRDLNTLCGQARYRKQIKRYVKGLRVQFTHRQNARERSIGNIEWQSADTYEFEKDGELITVSEYFSQIGHNLRFGSFGALACFGESSKVPLELLFIVPGQPYKGVIPESAAGEFLLFATKKPQERLRKLEESIRDLRHQDSPVMRQAGFSIEQRLLEVNARVLVGPSLECQEPQPLRANPRKGDWNMTRNRVKRAATIERIIIVNTDSSFKEERMKKAIQNLVEVLTNLGIVMAQGFQIAHFQHFGQSVDVRLDQIIDEGRERGFLPPTPRHVLVIVIVQEAQRATRESVKWWGDVKMGAITQILKSSKLREEKRFDQYARNVGLKINCKMRGLNFVPRNPPIPQLAGAVMIVGIDTSHPLDTNYPTTASLVYSIDGYCCDYRAIVRFQEPRKEVITDLQGMMTIALQDWRALNKRRFVERIIVYRDGVSEGQFEEVVGKEIQGIQNVLDAQYEYSSQKYNHNVKPQLTFIVVGKKHHVRMLPSQNDPSMLDDNRNALPGTVVDTEITTPEPGVFDFYLQSHGSILGTSRPAHYSVIRDDLRLSADQLQALSFALCHVYQIATRSVSIPAPVYYADQVAGRSAFHLHKINTDNASVSSDGLSFDWWKNQIALDAKQENLHVETRSRMYWL